MTIGIGINIPVSDRQIRFLVLADTPPTEADKIVNEDDSGDAILFENDDTWVTE